MNEVLNDAIVETSFGEFLKVVEEKIKEGWSIDWSNEGFPSSFVGMYRCGIYKENSEKTVGRPKKNN